MVDFTVAEPLLMLAEGEIPVLCLPPGLTPWQSEQAFGWAITELEEQERGWLALLRHTISLRELPAPYRLD